MKIIAGGLRITILKLRARDKLAAVRLGQRSSSFLQLDLARIGIPLTGSPSQVLQSAFLLSRRLRLLNSRRCFTVLHMPHWRKNQGRLETRLFLIVDSFAGKKMTGRKAGHLSGGE